MESNKGGGRTGQKSVEATNTEAMKTGYKEKIKYTLKYAIFSLIEAVLLLFKLLKKGGSK